MHQTSRAAPSTVGHSILDAADRWPERTAFILAGRSVTYAEFARQTETAARGLLALGIKPGEHVGVLMPNCWDYAVLVGAINMVGAAAVVLNARYRGEDLRFVIAHADITVLFTAGIGRPHLDLRALLCAEFPELARWHGGEPLAIAAAPKLRAVFHFQAPEEEAWATERVFAAGAATVSADILAGRIAAVRPEETALVIFSSGTTAQPKACLISHRTLNDVAGAVAERLGLVQDDVFWDPLPFYHMSSHLPLNACRKVGAAYLCQTHFDAGEALREMEAWGATICYPAFPTLTAAMIDHPDFAHRDLSRLRLMLNIGAPELLRKFAAALPQATQIACFGLTEGGGISVMSSPEETLEQRVTRVGRPLAVHAVRIVDPDTLAEVPAGTRGEILIRGSIFSGYYKEAEQTDKALGADGWLRTGDAGWLDPDGLLVYAGRIKDMLKIGGENVAAVEIESFLVKHPKVKMTQVVAVADDRLVEVAAAFVELKSGETMTADELIAYCAGRIASYKIPRYVRFVTEWPMSATKIQKFKLLESFTPTGKIDVASVLRRQPEASK
ncbi:class I adenylate-forming enzyme family protein [Chelatococcus asaccharovorans]|uniref:class I adenylate-forming enzyme family protein n=1 Tax=Chelatococcus asaccharovorans TaxID=28210 RepID=UPI00224C761B|nr:AMP-binding protein [Chelatococcus asaccharovorans]CAH1660500.1 Fatty-acyl-CoA synthase [Chelatococcus asaccharovorans]CAH1683779.1 Fatty-acyl-CoA synthase [Chelatococcus asaccharovorans]